MLHTWAKTLTGVCPAKLKASHLCLLNICKMCVWWPYLSHTQPFPSCGSAVEVAYFICQLYYLKVWLNLHLCKLNPKIQQDEWSKFYTIIVISGESFLTVWAHAEVFMYIYQSWGLIAPQEIKPYITSSVVIYACSFQPKIITDNAEQHISMFVTLYSGAGWGNLRMPPDMKFMICLNR